MSDRLTLLQSGARDLPVRQKTLRDTIDWSYDLLDTGEKQLFALLSIFSGCTFEAVEAVTGQISDMGKIDLVIGFPCRQKPASSGGTFFGRDPTGNAGDDPGIR